MGKQQKININSTPMRLAILTVAGVIMITSGFFLLRDSSGDVENEPASDEPVLESTGLTEFAKLQAEHPGSGKEALAFWLGQLEQAESGSEFRGDVYVQVASIYSNRQEHDKVIKTVEAAEAEGYEKRALYTVLGFTYQAQDNTEKLIETLQKELELLNPNDTVYADEKTSIEARINALQNN